MQARHLPSIQPLTARSVVLSTLLGYHPPALPRRALVRVAGLFGMAERSVRVALTRMVAAGDLVEEGDDLLRLSERLVARQARQEADGSPPVVPWPGDWEMAVVTAPPRPLPDRVALRKEMVTLRLAELREGVWARPANLARPWPAALLEQCTRFDGRPGGRAPEELARSLWDLDGWAGEARQLLDGLASAADLSEEFLVIAAGFRHLRLDPLLPPELLPAGWPGDGLRARHAEAVASFAERLRAYAQEVT